jgi:predicted nucleic-acid-binding Zn-ribbon protein
MHAKTAITCKRRMYAEFFKNENKITTIAE